MTDQEIPPPPETLGGWWCPACGTFKEQYLKPSRHWSWGELCRTEMQRIIYRRETEK